MQQIPYLCSYCLFSRFLIAHLADFSIHIFCNIFRVQVQVWCVYRAGVAPDRGHATSSTQHNQMINLGFRPIFLPDHPPTFTENLKFSMQFSGKEALLQLYHSYFSPLYYKMSAKNNNREGKREKSCSVPGFGMDQLIWLSTDLIHTEYHQPMGKLSFIPPQIQCFVKYRSVISDRNIFLPILRLKQRPKNFLDKYV